MHRCGTVEGGTAVSMVYFMNFFVQIRVVEEAMGIVAHCFVVHEETRDGDQEIQPAIFVDVGVQSVLS